VYGPICLYILPRLMRTISWMNLMKWDVNMWTAVDKPGQPGQPGQAGKWRKRTLAIVVWFPPPFCGSSLWRHSLVFELVMKFLSRNSFCNFCWNNAHWIIYALRQHKWKTQTEWGEMGDVKSGKWEMWRWGKWGKWAMGCGKLQQCST